MLVSSGDDSILLLFLEELLFRSKLYYFWLFCNFYTFFCVLFDWISAAFLQMSYNRLNWIKCFIIFTSDIIYSQGFRWVVSNLSFWLCQMFHKSCSFWTSWKTLLIAVCQKHNFSGLHSLCLCLPFLPIDNCVCFMLLTKHVICLNQYYCLINDEKSWYHHHCKLHYNYVIFQRVSAVTSKNTEPIVFVHSCEKRQEFGLTEQSHFKLLTVTAPVVVNCTWTSKDDTAIGFNTGFINKCVYSPMLLSTI